MDVLPAPLNRDSFRDSFKGLVALEIILDLPFGFPINNIISLVLRDLYLKRFDLTKGLLFDTFSITVWYKLCHYDHSVSRVRIILTTNELVDRTRTFKSNAFWFKQKNMKKIRCRPDFFHEKTCATGKTYQTRCASGQIFGPSPNGYSVLLIKYVIYFSQITAQNLLLLIN